MKVLQCESGLSTSSINYNKNGTYDVGIAQINSSHFSEMKKLGLSTTTPDILTYMFILLKRNGLGDYRSSKYCWNKD